MKKRFDLLQLAFLANVVAIIVAVAAAAILSWVNAASRNLALSTGALVAAAIAFVIQLVFELRSSESFDRICTEFTIDRATPFIRQWSYEGAPPWRMDVERRASDWLVANNPEAFDNDRGLITSNFILFSLLSSLTVQNFDWQLRKISCSSDTFGTVFRAESVSKDKDCNSVREEDLRIVLTESENLFAGAPLRLLTGVFRLPPKTKLVMTRTSVTIENPICRMVWTLDNEPSMISHIQPGTQGDVPNLVSGEPRYESMPWGMTVHVTYNRWRSQTPDMDKYHGWVSRILDDLREWFKSKL